jgi:hypothetical protein
MFGMTYFGICKILQVFASAKPSSFPAKLFLSFQLSGQVLHTFQLSG